MSCLHSFLLLLALLLPLHCESSGVGNHGSHLQTVHLSKKAFVSRKFHRGFDRWSGPFYGDDDDDDNGNDGESYYPPDFRRNRPPRPYHRFRPKLPRSPRSRPSNPSFPSPPEIDYKSPPASPREKSPKSPPSSPSKSPPKPLPSPQSSPPIRPPGSPPSSPPPRKSPPPPKTYPPPSSPPPPPAPQTPNSSPDINSWLSLQNKARADLGLYPLVWNASMAASALTWAQRLSSRGCGLVHGGHPGMGQNLAWWSSPSQTITDGVQLWIDEKPNYSYGKYPNYCNAGQCGHYTQIVWLKTKQVGCAASTANCGIVYVCHYYPPGNIIGEYPY